MKEEKDIYIVVEICVYGAFEDMEAAEKLRSEMILERAREAVACGSADKAVLDMRPDDIAEQIEMNIQVLPAKARDA